MWKLVENERRTHSFYLSLGISSLTLLIPKEIKCENLSSYIPIALCMSFTKYSKVTENKLKLMLPKLISFKQTCHVEGTYILYIISIAHELVISLNATKKA